MRIALYFTTFVSRYQEIMYEITMHKKYNKSTIKIVNGCY
jgi:hypothetical protein